LNEPGFPIGRRSFKGLGLSVKLLDCVSTRDDSFDKDNVFTMGGIERWRTQVKAHHSQSIAAQIDFDPEQDFWQDLAHKFRDDPYRLNDPLLVRLEEEFTGCDSLLDVGGGAGRLALPLALHREKVTVVDSSESMLNQLKEASVESGINNVEAIRSLWERLSFNVSIHSGSLCSHVVYGIEDIETFVRNINRFTADRVIVLAFMRSPQAHLEVLWELIHGEKRINLPGVPELMGVLWEMGMIPELSILETLGPHIYESEIEAINDLRKRIYVNEGTDKDKNLISLLEVNLSPVEGGLELVGSAGRTMCLVRWKPNELSRSL
jgi:SAM-dependent methyltransferase|tara:strand:+ start:1072 stop:2034 length:963 start_codon:yes stop_codon:yes gene_type:complete